MTIVWSPHARSLQDDILAQIRDDLSTEDAIRWYDRMCDVVAPLADFPYSGSPIPFVCFQTIPENIDSLRQTFCGPYRIVYEPVDGEIHILSIRHSRMLIAEGDTYVPHFTASTPPTESE